MRISIIGAGRVGRALGGRWTDSGHWIVYGVREPSDHKVADLPRVANVAEAVRDSELVVIALPWAAVQPTVTGLDIADRVVVDATNPLAANARELVADPSLSGAELIRDWTGSTRVVKAFNTTGSANMTNPVFPNGRILMPVAGDDADAKSMVVDLAKEIGFDAIDAGPLSAARDLEHLAMMWIRLAYPLGNGPDIAFSLMRR